MNYQRTLKSPVSVEGIGLHSGRQVLLVIRPARPGQGIVFVRTDLEHCPQIQALHKNVVNTQLATTLGRGKDTVSTVEHVLAALHATGVDNALIEVSGPEVPIMDGSATPFVKAIESVGTIAQAQARPKLVLRRKVEIQVGEKWAYAEPSSCLEIQGSIEWNHPAIGYQEFHYIEGKTPFSELSSARTFCLLKDVEMMRRMGLIRGGSLENAVVMDENSVLNPTGLRYPDELVRHKVLDALGDFKLAGIEIQGYFRMHRAGHDLHSQLLAAIFSNPDNYEIIGGAEEKSRSTEILVAAARSLVASVS